MLCRHLGAGFKPAPTLVSQLSICLERQPKGFTHQNLMATLTPLPLGFALLGEGLGTLLGVLGEEQAVVHLVGQG